MNVNQLIDELQALVIEGKLSGEEVVADSGLFRVTGVSIVPTVEDSYVQLVSDEYDEAQDS